MSITSLKSVAVDFAGGLVVESAYQCREYEFDPSPGKIIHVGQLIWRTTAAELACSRAHVMQLLSMFAATIEAHAPRALGALEPFLCNMKSSCSSEWPLLSETRERLAVKTQ